MLWRAHIIKTLHSSVNLKKEPKCEKFSVTKRNFHCQTYNLEHWDRKRQPSLVSKRYASTEPTGIDYITSTLAKFSAANISKLTGLPTFEELTKSWNLEHCMPVEIVQNGLEFLHTTCGLPWWSVIAVSALTARLLLLPAVVLAERTNARISNNLPQMHFLEKQLHDAQCLDDDLKTARLAQEISLFKNHKRLTSGLLTNSLVTLAQAPLFILFLSSLRALPKTELQSMHQGGLFWFTNLTASDPTFLLPIITSATLCLIVELTLRNSNLRAANKAFLYIFRAHPLIILPFTLDFSSAFLLFWTCYNFITLVQSSVFCIPSVRDYFKIEKIYSFKTRALVSPNTLVIQKGKVTKLNKNFMQEAEIRQRLQGMRFSKASKDLPGKVPSSISVESLPPISQRLKLKAIMESTKNRF